MGEVEKRDAERKWLEESEERRRQEAERRRSKAEAMQQREVGKLLQDAAGWRNPAKPKNAPEPPEISKQAAGIK